MFIIERKTMKTFKTTREEILQTAREIAKQKGIRALNMRTIASASGLALGTLYHYYRDKEELLSAVINTIWEEIFQECQKQEGGNFLAYSRHCYVSAAAFLQQYPDFFTEHRVVFDVDQREQEREKMSRTWLSIQQAMRSVLQRDTEIRPAVFDASFTEAKFIAFVFRNLLLLLQSEAGEDDIFFEAIGRILYERKENV